MAKCLWGSTPTVGLFSCPNHIGALAAASHQGAMPSF